MNAALDQAFDDAEALLLSRLGNVTLAMLSADFHKRLGDRATATDWRSRMPLDTATPPFVAAFSDPEAVARYADGPPRFVPGFADLHRMTRILLAERAAPTRRCWCWAPVAAWS